MIDYGRFAERLAAHRAHQDPAKRWDLYKELHAEWGYAPASERRPPSAELLAAVGQVAPDGYDRLPGIPAALAEWMSLEENITDEINAGGLEFVWPPEWCDPDAVGGGSSEPLEPDSPFVVAGSDDLRMVVFVADDQYIFELAYRSADAGVADPMVLRHVDRLGWTVAAPSLTEFALQQAAARLPIVHGWHATPPDEFEDKALERVRTTWPELGFSVGRDPLTAFTLHGGPDAIAMVADPEGAWWDYPLLLNGRTKEAAQAVAVLLGGDEAPLDQWYVWEGDL